ncbi:MAG: CaiB/BaiF CoA transferase family protein [Candidatus Dormibacteraceae bacterium]
MTGLPGGGGAPPLRLLEGIKVVAFTQFLLGPAAVQHLADMGADVIKVEPPGRGAWERSWSGADTFLNGVSAFFMLANRNQRSVTLNLKSAAGVEAARRLVAASDVVVENFRPGVMDRLGLGYDAASHLNKGIIYARASGYGSASPFRALPGQDLLVQAMSGLGAITGRAGQAPTPAGAAVVDQHGASLLAMGILGALVNRERTGEGQLVEVVMLQAALDLQHEPVVYHLNGARLARPESPVADTFHEAPYGFYPTADGHLAVSMASVKALSEVLGNPPALAEYEDPEVAFAQRDEIGSALEPLFADRDTASWVELLRSHGIWCAPVQNLDEALADPAMQYADPILELNHPQAGRVRLLKHPVTYNSGEAGLTRMPPELGEHTAEVLRELGYAAAEIEAMEQRGDI